MEHFKTVLNIGMKHKAVLGYGALSLIAAVGEKVFSSIVFQCPCNSWNSVYGLVFLLVPALILFFLGYFLNGPIWKYITGCCRSKKPGHNFCRKFQRCLCVFWQMTFVSALAPLIWISLALLNGSFYVCIVSGLEWGHICNHNAECIKELPHIACADTLPSQLSNMNITNVLGMIRAQSQVLGWTLILCVLIITILSACLSRCRSPVSYLQLKFWKKYIEKEQELFELKCKEHATKLAERNVASFFDHSIPGPFQTPSCKEWNQISSGYTFNKQKQCYSMLHKFVELSEENGSILSLEGDVLPPTEVNIVDGEII
ncbi:hypothetical protein GDO86_009706 [Hymenochirus boettgeri]|uniref:Uncharacterized protein n=1 Tax=Hymenochirus boettgeri TaxID=247094 RepID=A0A8T2JK22_9PIPI|nr:hypothetical protein GDO86_009706 [Hymenochirus boettgeri]